MEFLQQAVPGENRMLKRFSDNIAVAVIQHDDDNKYVDRKCWVSGAKGNEVLLIISIPKPGFFQSKDGRVWPRERVVGVACVVATETEGE